MTLEEKKEFKKIIEKIISKIDYDIVRIEISCKKSKNSIQYNISPLEKGEL